MKFSDFELDPRLLQGVQSLGFEQPTPIQIDAIPPALAGRDVLACAMTGSGKTAAFVLPILQRLLDQPRGTTRALVLAPTRELAAQIAEHFEALGAHTGIRCAAVFGGVSMGPQESAFRSGADVLIATPGRLLDHFQSPYAKLEGLEVLVLDEADRMLDMGFLPDIRRVLEHVPDERQTLFYSATLPPPIVALSRDILRDPERIDVDRPSAPATGVAQAVYPVAQDLKARLLVELLRRGEIESALVFTRTKHRANRLADFLARQGVDCDRIHGNRSQMQRTAALARFKAGECKVLVATDIAARGIDVEALSHVINFDVPNVPEDYIHRVGRTARASATGDAFTFVSPEESGELAAIERALGNRLPRRTLADFQYDQRPAERLEVPHAERIAAIRARKAEERARARAKLERREQHAAAEAAARSRRTQKPAGAGQGQPQSQQSQQPQQRKRRAHENGGQHAGARKRQGHGHAHPKQAGSWSPPGQQPNRPLIKVEEGAQPPPGLLPTTRRQNTGPTHRPAAFRLRGRI